MNAVTKKNLSMTKDAIRKRQKRAEARRAKEYEFYRNFPAALAARVAAEIRADEHANENPELYDNGAMHWFQNKWAGFKRLSKGNLKRIDIEDKYFPILDTIVFFEVVNLCPTTGCVAGWGATLTGNQMLIKPNHWDTSVEGVLDKAKGETVFVDQCRDYQTGEIKSIMEVGREAYGITRMQDDWLFSCTRGKEQVLWALDKLANGEAFVPFTIDDHPEGCPFDDDGNLIEEYEDAGEDAYHPDYEDA